MAFEYHSAAAENLFPEILPSNTNLIHYANRFGSKKYPPPLPLRRTFSILRNYGFGTIVTERSVWEIENGDYKNELCKKSNCGNRYDSCEEYIKSLENFYKKKLLKKECYRIAFFKSEFSDRGQIDGIKEGDLIAFCIVQRDTLRNKVKVDEQPPYVTESIIDLPEKRGNIFFINRSERTLSVCGRIFRISGNYFSQQNRITNCCAHASIKMAIRGFYPEATAETIHKAAANSHIALKGNDGFTPDQFVRAIRGLSGQKAKYFEARTLETSLHFLKLIYHAIESRFPVILLFTHEGAQTFPSHQACHAATLIGHTFNKNTWWAYAWRGYFPSSYGYLQYLPSVMWCDTFIIQDDNLGPYYRLPLHSLKITEMPKIIPDSIKRFIQDARFFISKFSSWIYRPISCIVVYPKDLPSFEDVLRVEPYHLEWLNNYINYLKEIEYRPSNTYYRHYFLRFFKAQSLVLRTFALLKDEYLYHFSNYPDFKEKDDLYKAIDYSLPEYLWITEISIPELYWINKMKLGEILSSPEMFRDNPRSAVKFLKLPGLASFFKGEGKTKKFETDEEDSRIPLIVTECPGCFTR